MVDSAVSAPGPRPRILVVEDDEAILTALIDALEQGGYETHGVREGRAALERLRSQPAPDLIVLDLMMPVMDGWEFRTVQRADPLLADVPVLAISADGSAKASAIDAASFLKKPFRFAELIGAVARILDQREQRRLRERLIESERLATLGALAAGASHDISNPISVVVMNLSLIDAELGHAAEALSLLAREPLPRVGAELVRRVDSAMGAAGEGVRDARAGAERVVTVVRLLQDLAHRSRDPHEPVDVRQVIDEALAVAWPHIEGRARVVRRFEAVPAMAPGSRARLRQLFANLLINAAQAIPRDGRDHEITVTTAQDGAHVVSVVRDTGEGIAPEARPRLFEPFFTTRPGGTGLGLALCAAIAAEHAGRIEVDSAPGRGSEFRVTLPRRPGPSLTT